MVPGAEVTRSTPLKRLATDCKHYKPLRGSVYIKFEICYEQQVMKTTIILLIGALAPLQSYSMAKWVDERVWNCPGDEQQLMSCRAKTNNSQLHPSQIIECLKEDKKPYFLLNFENADTTATVRSISPDEKSSSISYQYKGTNFTLKKNSEGNYFVTHSSHFLNFSITNVSDYDCYF